MKTGRKQSKILWSQQTDRQTDRQTDHGQTRLSNMLVKKNVLNKINQEGTFTQGFKDCREIKRKVSQNLDLLIKFEFRENVATLWVSILFKSRWQTKWYTGMKEIFIIISSKYRRPVPRKLKETLKLMKHFRGSKIKPTKYYIVARQKNCLYESFLWGTQQKNLHLLYLHLL